MQPQTTTIQLADIHLPDSVSIWPLAPIYWLVLALVIVVAIMIWLLRHRRHLNAYRRASIQLLRNSLSTIDSKNNVALVIQTNMEILRRVAKQLGAPTSVLTSSNSNFIEWLKLASPKSTHLLTKDVENLMIDGLYQPSPKGDSDKVSAFTEHWLVHHRARSVNQANQAGESHV